MVFSDERFSVQSGNDSFIAEAKTLIAQLAQEPPETTNVLRRYVIDVNGSRVSKRVQEVWFYPTSTAVESYGTELIYFNESNSKVVLNVAASILADGKVAHINPKTIQFGEQDGYNTFSDGKVAYLPIPGLTKGSYAVIDYLIVEDIELNQAGYSDMFWAEGDFPVLKVDIQINWQDVDLATKNSHPLVNCTYENKTTQCQGENIPGFDFGSRGFWRDKVRGLYVATEASWDDVVDTMLVSYNKAFLEVDQVDPLYARLTQGLTSQEDKINAIFRFVSEDIRYVSLSTAGYTHQPHSNNSVINNRFGDCKDKTALLQSLLERAGINVTPVLVATERSKPEKLPLPSLGYFNHIILCFDLNGQEYCLDPTDPNTYWNVTSDWIQGKVSLALRKGGQPRVLPASAYRWQMDIETSMTLTRQGGSEEFETRTYYGEYAAFMRSQLEGVSKQGQIDMLANQYRDVIADLDEVFVRVLTPVEGDRATFQVATKTRFDPYFDTDGALTVFEDEYWINDELSSLVVEGDDEEFEIGGFRFLSRKNIDFSVAWQVDMKTPRLNLDHRFGRAIRDTVINDGVMSITTLVEVPHQVVATDDIVEFNRFISAVSHAMQIRIHGKAL
jgi:hypothetical protein